MRTHWKVYIIGLLITLMLAIAGHWHYSKSDALRVKVSRDATLVQAYEYSDRCGHKGHYECSAYKGRFLVEPEHMYINRDIDGFWYHNYVAKGRVDSPAYVTVSKVDLGAKEPAYTSLWRWMMMMSTMLFFIWFFVMGIACLFEDSEIRDRRRYGY